MNNIEVSVMPVTSAGINAQKPLRRDHILPLDELTLDDLCPDLPLLNEKMVQMRSVQEDNQDQYLRGMMMQDRPLYHALLWR